MTGITLDTSYSMDEVAIATVKKIATIVLMTLAVVFTMSLLSFVMDTNRAKISAVEHTQITAQMRERQLGCLAKNIYYEAGNQPFEGKVAVAQVTINRTESGLFSDDICNTIYQKNIVYEKVLCQFSWVCDREVVGRKINKEVYEESMAVAKKVLLEGFRLPSLTEAMYFHGDYINPGWRREKIAKIGNHIFYK
jgi:spore germination cell wall hydrolase CwlJ-like protein